ncbi:carboxymuconolactone decarboxylase family protein [Nonomuraea phyllanthi]|uniref:Carboxymuconolactone decarboxylase family protein n=1 Tax=Nonomuraea phyllanthi TaxID=2219224 RepID=A0A5C4WL44_9ACTN|nr:carboxymuconolactone decarboxylase family protein [Nonomuraea phyllanthi]KAB8194785.1 carboxymuconolactone decarboxylase family protein [Nonomuraea phyllanthi]QFY09206.1 carboxymuconolactone decarboxylase family protein [Nonomuraea phyllanthi]
MKERMNAFGAAPESFKALVALEASLRRSGLPERTLELVRLRASQINGCAYCVDMHAHDAKKAGESDERLFALAAWREAPYFTDEERAALALTEAATRLADNPAGVPDDVWDAAADHYDEPTLAALIWAIAAINAWNRVNVTTRLIAGSHR